MNELLPKLRYIDTAWADFDLDSGADLNFDPMDSTTEVTSDLYYHFPPALSIVYYLRHTAYSSSRSRSPSLQPGL